MALALVEGEDGVHLNTPKYLVTGSSGSLAIGRRLGTVEKPASCAATSRENRQSFSCAT